MSDWVDVKATGGGQGYGRRSSFGGGGRRVMSSVLEMLLEETTSEIMELGIRDSSYTEIQIKCSIYFRWRLN